MKRRTRKEKKKEKEAKQTLLNFIYF